MTTVLDGVSEIHLSWRPTSATLCHRSSGSFAKQVRIVKSRVGGVVGWTEHTGLGWAARMAAIVDAAVFPSNALVPVTISYSTAPSAKISLRESASLPSTCSGDMYWNVPTTVPSFVTG